MSVRALAITSNASAAVSILTDYMPLIQVIAVVIAIISGLGAIHLTILKIRLAKKQLNNKSEGL